MSQEPPASQPPQEEPSQAQAVGIPPNSALVHLEHNNLNLTPASLRGSPSDRIIKPRPRKDSLQSISGSDFVPGRVQKPRARKSPGSGAKRSEPSKRKFICSFSHYGCDVALSSKNEWKRHVSIQHLQLGFYRCDVGSCNPDSNPGVPGHKKVYNDFNRKDLFTQHHRRMHKPETAPNPDVSPTTAEGGKDWQAFEASLEDVRNRCWHERRRPPQRSTCGFCGKVFEGEGSWNERMEHVGSHFSRDIPEACKEEREDEDLTAWAIQEGIIKDSGNGRHVLIDQPPTAAERPYMARDRDVAMSDAPPMTPTHANGNGKLEGEGHERRDSLSNGQNSLQELVNTLLQPKGPRTLRRFTWKCDCNLEMSVDLDENDERSIDTLGKVSIICKNTSSAYLKSMGSGHFNIIPCDELPGYIRRAGKEPIEHHLPTIQETLEAPATNHTVPTSTAV